MDEQIRIAADVTYEYVLRSGVISVCDEYISKERATHVCVFYRKSTDSASVNTSVQSWRTGPSLGGLDDYWADPGSLSLRVPQTERRAAVPVSSGAW